ncbi:hypothetical protein LguiA_014622 [Lonicera macranthoides]
MGLRDLWPFLLVPPELWLFKGRELEPIKFKGRPSLIGPLNSCCYNGSMDKGVHCADGGDLHGSDNRKFWTIGYTSKFKSTFSIYKSIALTGVLQILIIANSHVPSSTISWRK